MSKRKRLPRRSDDEGANALLELGGHAAEDVISPHRADDAPPRAQLLDSAALATKRLAGGTVQLAQLRNGRGWALGRKRAVAPPGSVFDWWLLSTKDWSTGMSVGSRSSTTIFFAGTGNTLRKAAESTFAGDAPAPPPHPELGVPVVSSEWVDGEWTFW